MMNKTYQIITVDRLTAFNTLEPSFILFIIWSANNFTNSFSIRFFSGYMFHSENESNKYKTQKTTRCREWDHFTVASRDTTHANTSGNKIYHLYFSTFKLSVSVHVSMFYLSAGESVKMNDKWKYLNIYIIIIIIRWFRRQQFSYIYTHVDVSNVKWRISLWIITNFHNKITTVITSEEKVNSSSMKPETFMCLIVSSSFTETPGQLNDLCIVVFKVIIHIQTSTTQLIWLRQRRHLEVRF